MVVVAVLSFASVLPVFEAIFQQAPSMTASPADSIKNLVCFIIAFIFVQSYEEILNFRKKSAKYLVVCVLIRIFVAETSLLLITKQVRL